jgi:NADPH:quinone reductase-like Zn-dependent oxidoreductase
MIEMKAVVCTKYGSPDVLQLAQVEKPVPKNNEVLVEVHAASVNKFDWIVTRGKPFIVRLAGVGLLRPKNRIPGADVAGRIETVGRDVKQFKPGDEVFGDLAWRGLGSYAEYVCAHENALALKPANITFEEAAAVPMAALTALQGLRKGRIQPGQRVLINGASGGVGTFALQIAKSFGAEVTAVCSTRNLDVARSIGADYVVDYTQEDFTKNGRRYDLIVGANGYQSISAYRRALSPKGIYIMTGGSGAQIFQAMLLGPLISKFGSKKMGSSGTSKSVKEDYAFLSGLLEARKIVPVIDRRYQLSQVPEALQYLGEGHARGKVVITVEHDNGA